MATGMRGANGYAETVPEERKFVLASLTVAADKLRSEDSVSFLFIRRFVIEPLSILVSRFGNAVIGALAKAAVESFKIWLKEHGVHF